MRRQTLRRVNGERGLSKKKLKGPQNILLGGVKLVCLLLLLLLFWQRRVAKNRCLRNCVKVVAQEQVFLEKSGFHKVYIVTYTYDKIYHVSP